MKNKNLNTIETILVTSVLFVLLILSFKSDIKQAHGNCEDRIKALEARITVLENQPHRTPEPVFAQSECKHQIEVRLSND